MIFRKIVAGLTASAIMVLIYSAFSDFEIGIFYGMFLLPIVLIFGTLSSIYSDSLTKRLKGFKRMFMAFIIHVFSGALLIIISKLLSEHDRDRFVLELSGLLNNFFFVSAVSSAFIFWFIDELIRSDKCKKILNEEF